jgi:hypothetical protein
MALVSQRPISRVEMLEKLGDTTLSGEAFGAG